MKYVGLIIHTGDTVFTSLEEECENVFGGKMHTLHRSKENGQINQALYKTLKDILK